MNLSGAKILDGLLLRGNCRRTPVRFGKVQPGNEDPVARRIAQKLNARFGEFEAALEDRMSGGISEAEQAVSAVIEWLVFPRGAAVVRLECHMTGRAPKHMAMLILHRE